MSNKSSRDKAPKVDEKSIKEADDKIGKQSVADSDDGDNCDKDDDRSKSANANNDDDKHDGRGHGDGDHNDDGHSDNGHSENGKRGTDGVQVGTNLLLDGSFEQATVKAGTWTHQKTVGGWQSDSEVEVWGKDFKGIKATEGDKFAELDFDSKQSNIYQDVKTEAGAEYTFSFDTMKRPDSKEGSDSVLVFWNGAEVGRIEPGKAWSNAEFNVVGTGGIDRIEFREDSSDNDSYGGLIDNAKLVKTGLSTPEQGAEEPTVGGGNEVPVVEEPIAEETMGGGDVDQPEIAEPAAEEPVIEEPGIDEPVAEEPVVDAPVVDEPVSELPVLDEPVIDMPVDPLPPVVDEEPKRTIVLEAADIRDAWTGQTIVGTNSTDGMNGGAGNDDIMGKKGNDEINGDDVGSFTADLKISASISDGSDVRLVVAGMPDGARLSAGVDNRDGTWTLTSDLLAGLQITSPDAAEFSLQIKAVAADGSDLSASTEIKVSFLGGFDDLIQGGQGADVLNGQAGDDIIYGGSKPTGLAPPREPVPGDDDTITAGDGNDVVYAGSGNDKVWGDAGNDWISGGRGNDLLSGGEGDDVIYGNSGDDMIWGDEGHDLVEGGSGNDTLSGHTGDDTLRGGTGDDVFYTDAGTDAIFGGSGFDTLVLSSWAGDTGTYVVDLSNGIVGNSEVGFDSLSSIEAVVGGYGNDLMQGSTKANRLDGGAGDDVLRGGAGADTLTGGAGNDTFVFLGKDVTKLGGGSLGVDIITDFQVGDIIDVSDMTYSRKAAYSLKDDGQDTVLMAQVKGQMVEVAVLENFSGHTLEDMIANGMLIV